MTTINKLSAVDTIAAGDQFVIYSQRNGDARRVSGTVVKEFMTDAIETDDAVTFSSRINLIAGSVSWQSGTGSPEGSITASVGSLWTNTSGGAGTTLYVKESGTGNTGWAAV